jgi:simple sugar transport system ATP-binding protein
MASSVAADDSSSAAALTPVLELRGITKNFGSTVANDDVSLRVNRGELHAVVGENGAGKSTLMKIVAGVIGADAGQILVDGQAVTIDSPHDAARAGVGMVHQHFSLVPSLSIAENIFLGALPTRAGVVRRRRMARDAAEMAATYGLEIPNSGRLGDFGVGVQQRVEILKALLSGSKVLILDEPTAVLTPQESDHLFEALRALQGSGHTVILITHKLREVFAAATRVTVMRDGRAFETSEVADASESQLIHMMVGREVKLGRPDVPLTQDGAAVLRIEHLACRNNRKLTALHDISLTVRSGEIVGIAGVEGNGQEELCEAIAGLRAIEQGQLFVLDRNVTAEQSAAKRRASGVTYIPADRMLRGVAPHASIRDNLIMGKHREPPIAQRGRLQPAAIAAMGDVIVKRFNVSRGTLGRPIGSLSGGNIQKIVTGRELAAGSPVLVASNPTRGVDIGAAEMIHNALRAARTAGVAILLVSSELDEVKSLSDRVFVMSKGELHGPWPPQVSDEQLGLAMTGGGEPLQPPVVEVPRAGHS